jgi:hypothetical protein
VIRIYASLYLWVAGHFAEKHFAERHYANGPFAERTLCTAIMTHLPLCTANDHIMVILHNGWELHSSETSHSPKHFDEIISLFSADCPFGKLSVGEHVRPAKRLRGLLMLRSSEGIVCESWQSRIATGDIYSVDLKKMKFGDYSKATTF